MDEHQQAAALARLADRRRRDGTAPAAEPHPPPPVDRGEIRVPDPPDAAVARRGLPRHPTPKVLAGHLRDVADALEIHGRAALDLAPVLAARGWPSGTAGGGVSGGGASIRVLNEDGDEELVPVTSTEAAAMHEDRWADADRELAARLRALFTAAARAHQFVADLAAHADDADPLPAGTGECQACGRFVRPTKARPDDRLRSGLCDRDRQAWKRSGLDRQAWLAQRRTDPAEAAAVPLGEGATSCREGHVCCVRAAEHEHWHAPGSCPACLVVVASAS